MSQTIDLTGLTWRVVPFEGLTTVELYRALRLRAEVFVVEQNCAFQDLDGLDPVAVHLMGETTDQRGVVHLCAYARLLPGDTAFAEASIGRVVTSPAARGSGLGHQLMHQAVGELHRLWGVQPIRIGAQAHLQRYYGQSGFEPQGAIYMEDGIEHVEMLRTGNHSTI